MIGEEKNNLFVTLKLVKYNWHNSLSTHSIFFFFLTWKTLWKQRNSNNPAPFLAVHSVLNEQVELWGRLSFEYDNVALGVRRVYNLILIINRVSHHPTHLQNHCKFFYFSPLCENPILIGTNKTMFLHHRMCVSLD